MNHRAIVYSFSQHMASLSSGLTSHRPLPPATEPCSWRTCLACDHVLPPSMPCPPATVPCLCALPPATVPCPCDGALPLTVTVNGEAFNRYDRYGLCSIICSIDSTDSIFKKRKNFESPHLKELSRSSQDSSESESYSKESWDDRLNSPKSGKNEKRHFCEGMKDY